MTKNLALFLALIMLVLGVGGVAEASAPSRTEVAVDFALAQVGDAYVYGAQGPNAWDCSALVQAAYRHAGIRLPRTTYGMQRVGRRVPLSAMRRGDLVIYPGHVALYLGQGRQVAATKPSTGVKTQRVYWGAEYGIRVVR